MLQAAGHEAIAVDLPGDDPTAGLPEYAGLVEAAIGNRDNVVLVAMSLGGFTAPLVAKNVPVSAMVRMMAATGPRAIFWTSPSTVVTSAAPSNVMGTPAAISSTPMIRLAGTNTYTTMRHIST